MSAVLIVACIASGAYLFVYGFLNPNGNRTFTTTFLGCLIMLPAFAVGMLVHSTINNIFIAIVAGLIVWAIMVFLSSLGAMFGARAQLKATLKVAPSPLEQQANARAQSALSSYGKLNGYPTQEVRAVALLEELAKIIEATFDWCAIDRARTESFLRRMPGDGDLVLSVIFSLASNTTRFDSIANPIFEDWATCHRRMVLIFPNLTNFLMQNHIPTKRHFEITSLMSRYLDVFLTYDEQLQSEKSKQDYSSLLSDDSIQAQSQPQEESYSSASQALDKNAAMLEELAKKYPDWESGQMAAWASSGQVQKQSQTQQEGILDSSVTWAQYSCPQHNFTVDFPGSPVINKRTMGDPHGCVNLYEVAGRDVTAGVYIAEFAKGSFSDVHALLYLNEVQLNGALSQDSSITNLNRHEDFLGYSATVVEAQELNDSGQAITIYSLGFIRGDSTYELAVAGLSQTEPAVRQTFNKLKHSFHFNSPLQNTIPLQEETFCKKCGTSTEFDSRFCIECGTQTA
ncbi:MAG: zinc ribbon domain-containing protein [Coriobacteriia bacterium]|nr:zinc ribbon domain-containing protein [Coriobacteriia bacterium]